jgi:hypothetical protein
MGCEKSFIIIKLRWHRYLVFNLGSRAHETCTKTGLSAALYCPITIYLNLIYSFHKIFKIMKFVLSFSYI